MAICELKRQGFLKREKTARSLDPATARHGADLQVTLTEGDPEREDALVILAVVENPGCVVIGEDGTGYSYKIIERVEAEDINRHPKLKGRLCFGTAEDCARCTRKIHSF